MHVRTAVAALVILTGLYGVAGAQYFDPDHLDCFRLRVPKSRWSATDHAFDAFTLTPAVPDIDLDRGCRLVPEKHPVPRELCVPAAKTPSLPPSGSPGYQSLLCYEARCEAALVDEAPLLADQFGSGQPIVKRRDRKRRVCVPTAACHDVCVEGLPLAPACGECAARVCESDPFCCEYSWFYGCVQRAAELCGACPGVPTPFPTPSPSPSPGPSPGPGTACTSAIVTVSVSFDAVRFPNVAGVTVSMRYSEASLAIPGFGSDPRVLARVSNLTGIAGALFSAGDLDYETPAILNVGMISIAAAIPPGPFTRIEFDCVGPDEPVPADLSCIPDLSDLMGNIVPATCSVTVETLPPIGSATAAFLEQPTSLFE